MHEPLSRPPVTSPTDSDRQQPSPQWPDTLFHSLAETAVVGLYVLENERFLYANETLADMLGYSRAEMLEGITLFDVVAQHERELVSRKVSTSLSGEVDRVHYERQALRKDGSHIDVEIFGVKITLQNRKLLMGAMLDVTQRRKTEETAALTSLVYEHSSEAMVITQPNGAIITVNPAFTTITGYSLDEVVGKRLNILSSGRHDRAFYHSMWSSIIETGSWRGEIWNRRKNGDEYAEHLTINTSFNSDGTARYRLGLFSDITEKKIRDDQIWRQANFDYLTGLPNRKRFYEKLNTKIKHASEVNNGFALLYLDLDDFKDINDTLGHANGDVVLRIVAARLKRCVRTSDTVARLGGDEFCILLDGVNTAKQAGRVCEKIIQTLGEPYTLGQNTGRVVASIGVAFYPNDAREPNELINNADLAMYASKDLGKGQYSFFTAEIRELAQARRQLLYDLSNAVEAGQLCLHYQPVIDLETGKIIKAEALVRWQHPEHGLIPPDQFIPLAESSGLILDIGDWVFHEALAQIAKWRTAYNTNISLSINVSPAQLHHEKMQPGEWLAEIRRLNLHDQSLIVEITEGILIDANPDVFDKLLAFRDAGMHVALDDFGTGYSSLPYLRKFDIDYIKIDRSFMTNLATNADDRDVCDAIIMMAHRLGLQVIAEGVETVEQYHLLQAMNCDAIQGYLISRPLPPEQFERLFSHPPAVPATPKPSA